MESAGGRVVAVAEEATEDVAVGDRVVYRETGASEVRVEGEDYVLVPSENLLVKYVATDAIPE